jgi:hypothetical protein
MYTNKKKYILLEETRNLNQFIERIEQNFMVTPNFQFVEPFKPELKEFLIKFIINSDCQYIIFEKFNYPAYGLAVHDGVLINDALLSQKNLSMLMYVIFHEIAHQYQFKKYGADKIYEMYKEEVSPIKASEMMIQIEHIADRFACMKIEQIKKLNLIKKHFVCPQYYKNHTAQSIFKMVKDWKERMQRNNIVTKEQISEFGYNLIKVKVENPIV